MKTILLCGAALGVTLLLPRSSEAQIQVDVHFGSPPPPVYVAPPPPVVVHQPVVVAQPVYAPPVYAPGVFFAEGAYWSYHQNHWYRAHGKRWVYVQPHYVPAKVAHRGHGGWGRGHRKAHVVQARHAHHRHRR